MTDPLPHTPHARHLGISRKEDDESKLYRKWHSEQGHTRHELLEAMEIRVNGHQEILRDIGEAIGAMRKLFADVSSSQIEINRAAEQRITDLEAQCKKYEAAISKLVSQQRDAARASRSSGKKGSGARSAEPDGQ